MTHIPNLNSLYNDMIKRHWSISSCHFKYIDHYNVLIKISSKFLCNKGYDMNFEFIDKDNDNKSHLKIAVKHKSGFTADIYGKNSNKMGIIIKNYFGVVPNINGNKFTVNGFLNLLNKRIPSIVPKNYPEDLKMDMVYSLGDSDPSDDPDKIYLYAARNDPHEGKRTIFNDNKTRLLYLSEYKDILDNASNSDNISFLYSKDPKYRNAYKNL